MPTSTDPRANAKRQTLLGTGPEKPENKRMTDDNSTKGTEKLVAVASGINVLATIVIGFFTYHILDKQLALEAPLRRMDATLKKNEILQKTDQRVSLSLEVGDGVIYIYDESRPKVVCPIRARIENTGAADATVGKIKFQVLVPASRNAFVSSGTHMAVGVISRNDTDWTALNSLEEIIDVECTLKAGETREERFHVTLTNDPSLLESLVKLRITVEPCGGDRIWEVRSAEAFLEPALCFPADRSFQGVSPGYGGSDDADKIILSEEIIEAASAEPVPVVEAPAGPPS